MHSMSWAEQAVYFTTAADEDAQAANDAITKHDGCDAQ